MKKINLLGYLLFIATLFLGCNQKNIDETTDQNDLPIIVQPPVYENKTYAVINLEQTKPFKLGSNDDSCFSFTAQYSSNYEIEIESPSFLKVDIDGDVIYGEYGLKLNKYVAMDKTMLLEVFEGQDGLEGTMVISPSTTLDDIVLQGKELYILKLNSVEGLKRFKTNDEDVLISGFYENSFPSLVRHYSLGSFHAASIVDHGFEKTEGTYYLTLSNSTNIEQTITLSILEIEELIVDSEQPIYPETFTYFKFVAPSTDIFQFNMEFTELAAEGTLRFFDSNFGYVSAMNGSTGFSAQLIGGDTYYIGVCAFANAVKVNFEKQELICYWVVTDEFGNSETIHDGKIYVPRGVKYYFEFWIYGESHKMLDSYHGLNVLRYEFDEIEGSLIFDLESPTSHNFGVKVSAWTDSTGLYLYLWGILVFVVQDV